ncbi:MAG: ACT domain-containing protein [Oscillospiraceae bacterium]|nr:ACT domain-containing protein [Oscillospiraceae bacterium]
MAIKQLTVFLENKAGKLSEIVKRISDADVNIRAMCIADSSDCGILRLIVSDLEKAENALKGESIMSAIDVLAVKMTDKAGSLSEILTVLDKAGINIDYMYAFTAPALGAYVVLRVGDNSAAESVLKQNGIKTLTDEDMKAF